jgi:hypothetical protein
MSSSVSLACMCLAYPAPYDNAGVDSILEFKHAGFLIVLNYFIV